MILPRRSFFGLLAAPALVKIGNIMQVRRLPLVMPKPALVQYLLSGVLISPGSFHPGPVSIRTGNENPLVIFAGGPVPSLIPFWIPIGIASSEPWVVEGEDYCTTVISRLT